MFILDIVIHIQSFLLDTNKTYHKIASRGEKSSEFPLSCINQVSKQWNHAFYYLISKRKEYRKMKLELIDLYIKNKMVGITMFLIKNDWKNLKRCYVQTKKICFSAPENNPQSLRYIKNQCLQVFEKQALAYQNEKNNKKPNLKKISQIKKTLKYVNFKKINNSDYEIICDMFVSLDGEFIEHVRSEKLSNTRYYDLCKKSVRNNGMCLYLIKKKTKELCDIAINNNYMSKRYASPRKQCILGRR